MSSIWVLMRHASRDSMGLDQLSPEGHAQSAELTTFLLEKAAIRPDSLTSSPKLRTRQTMRFFGELLKREVSVDIELDERARNESPAAFEQRVKKVIGEKTNAARERKPPHTAISCTHLDWLELATVYLPSDESELEKTETWLPGAFRIYVFEEGIWRRK